MTVPKLAIDSASHYVSKGLTRDSAVAIIAVLYSGESGLSTGPQKGNHGGVLGPHAVGIASWNGERQGRKPGDDPATTREGLKDFADLHGRDWQTIDTQLDFVLTECANYYPSVWSQLTQGPIASPNGSHSEDYKTIIGEFVRKYEVPAEPDPEIARSLAFAAQLYQLVPETAASSPITPREPQRASQKPAPPPPPPSQPASQGTPPMPAAIDPVAILLVQLFAPLLESAMQGLVKALLQHITAQIQPPETRPLDQAAVASIRKTIEDALSNQT